MLSPSRQQRVLRETLTASYAAGVLSPALALLVETQAALSAHAARDVALADATAGALFERETPSPLAADAFERVLARLSVLSEEGPRQLSQAAVGSFIEELSTLPEPVRARALDALSRHGWKFASSGIKSLTLEVGGFAKAEILRIEPGAAAPEHTHEGEEFTLVMTGAFHDSRALYRLGDIAFADENITHRPTGAAGSVCYSLAVTDAPLAFTGALGLMQKIWKH